MVSGQSLYHRILEGRNIASENLETSLEDLPDEKLLANIESAAERIHEAVYRNEDLIIFGHDDPDGVTSTYILYNFLNNIGFQKHSYYIPNRNLESHGIQENFINHVKQGGHKLVITVDNGIVSDEGVKKLNELGCDVIITDHHLIQPDKLPEAYAIINPLLSHCEYPFKQLAGVGVALMLIRYLAKQWNHSIDPASYFWTAVGSIADKVPMIGLNRTIVRYVLENFETVQDDTVRFLLRNYRRVNTPTDVFNFINYTARIIANGREAGGEHTALKFIIQISDAKATLFENLEEQKNLWENDLNRVFAFLDTLTVDFVGNFFVYFDDEGVIPYALLGTAASYVVNRLQIPTIMFKPHSRHTVCEGRCSDGFNMVESFGHCKEHLIQFGGHPKAAGFTMESAAYDDFVECFHQYVSDNFIPPAKGAEIPFDTQCTLAEMDDDTWQDLELLLPWGQQNPEPVLKIKDLKAEDLSGKWNLDGGSLRLARNLQQDCIVMWRGASQLRILKILD